MKKIAMLLIPVILLVLFSSCAETKPIAGNITGNYIVQLKAGDTIPDSVNAELIFPEADVWLAQSLKDVKAMGDAVLSYSPERYMELLDYPETTDDTYFDSLWGLSAVNAAFARELDIRGENVTVAVIDSGIDRNNPDFDSDRILPGMDLVATNRPYDPSDTSDPYVGHGTMVAGIIAAKINNGELLAGIADKVNILPLRITVTGIVAEGFVIRALRYALDYGCDVVNLSMGVSGKPSAEMQACVDRLLEKGIIVVAAAGNAGSASMTYPAGLNGVIGVGSVTSELEHSSFSNHNSSVFCAAPGSNITGLVTNDHSAVKTGNGTSYAAPFVSAAAALVKSIDPELTPDEFKQLLIDSCTDLGEPGYDEYFGYGLLNIQKMLEIQLEKLGYPVTAD
ncbi:MAG: S8 family serine peptidase [Oscillospiraceae bacterium]|nr:S8 family serine peptidase [Oscillospiraceae bacterium]